MNSVFSERLAPLRARMDRQRAAIRPVSRVWFELSDKTAFSRCIALSLNWMESRSQVKLPAEAWKGESFDVTDVLGANPTKAIRVDVSDGSIWAARLDFPDPQFSRTWVSEFFAERRNGSLSRFGAQLTCVIRGDSPNHDITRPNVVRHILETLSAEADGWSLMETATKLDQADVSLLEELLYSPNRRLPVIAISEMENAECRVSPDALARQVAGAAHIVHLSREASWELTRSIGKRMSVFGGATRLYLPNLSEENEDPYQHPLWLFQNGGESQFIRDIAARVLPFAFLGDGGSENFPRFSAIRDFVARRALEQHPSSTERERAVDELAVLKDEFDEVIEERDSWESLAQEEQVKRLAADAEIERLKEENSKLAAKASALEHRLSQKTDSLPIEEKVDRPLEAYEDLEDWAEEVLGYDIRIHQAALKDCKKNGHDNMLDRIESALIVIRDYLVPLKIHGGLDRRNLFHEKLGEIGMEDTPCFVDRDEARRAPGYSVQYEGNTEILYDHIKYGNGYDNANQIRIYYFWDSQRKRLVIGKMPSHLKNNLTS